MIGAILCRVAMVATIVDGGNVLAQQRVTQNGVGCHGRGRRGHPRRAARRRRRAIGRLGRQHLGPAHPGRRGQRHHVEAAYYTDICGIPLEADGTGAINVDRTEDLAVALQVSNGSHILPGGTATAPDCPNRLVGPWPACWSSGGRTCRRTWPARSASPRSGSTPARRPSPATSRATATRARATTAPLLPVAFPSTSSPATAATSRSDSGEPWVFNTVYKSRSATRPRATSATSTGTPTPAAPARSCARSQTPDNPAIDLPSWQYVAVDRQLERRRRLRARHDDRGGAPRTYEGETVLAPQFDLTCHPAATAILTRTARRRRSSRRRTTAARPAPSAAAAPNIWYRFPSFAFFELCGPGVAGCGGRHAAYLQGNNCADLRHGQRRDVLPGRQVHARHGDGHGRRRRRLGHRQQGGRRPAHQVARASLIRYCGRPAGSLGRHRVALLGHELDRPVAARPRRSRRGARCSRPCSRPSRP